MDGELAMTQVLFYVALHLIGVSLCLASGQHRRIALACALGFPLGLAAMVATVLVMLSVGIPYSPVTGALAAALLVGFSLARARRRLPDRRGAMIIAVWTVGFFLIAAPLCHFNLSMLTFDSHYIVMMGRAVMHDGAFTGDVLPLLGDYGIFTVLAHTGVGFMRVSYAYALAPVLSVSSLVLFATAVWYAVTSLGLVGSRRSLLTALVTIALLSTPMVFRHTFYIHTNLGTGIYLWLFGALWWLAEQEGDTDLLPPAFLALLAMSLHRIEGPLIAVVFLCLTSLPSRLPARARLIPMAGFAAMILLWYGRLAGAAAADAPFLTPSRCYVMMAAVVAFAVYAAVSTRVALLARINRVAPVIVAVVTALSLVAAFAVKSPHMLESTGAWLQSLTKLSYWGGTWITLAALAVIALFAPPAPFRAVFVVGATVQLAGIALLGFARPPYYVGLHDSGNRMALHAVLLAFFYLTIKYAPLLRPASSPGR